VIAPSPAPDPQVLVPDVVGKAFKHARATLLELGLQVSRTYKLSATKRTGTILSQSPEADSEVDPGTTINLLVARSTATPSGITCPTTPLLGVYHSYRLTVLKTCQWFVGTVVLTRTESYDGDHHINIAPDKGYEGFLNQDNYSYQHGGLLVEIMPGQDLPIPYVGERISVFGTSRTTDGRSSIRPGPSSISTPASWWSPFLLPRRSLGADQQGQVVRVHPDRPAHRDIRRVFPSDHLTTTATVTGAMVPRTQSRESSTR
jgi:hypothetical protein